jgi:hypothetical protein
MGADAHGGDAVRLLLDMGLPRRSAGLLGEAGHDAVHLSVEGLGRDKAVRVIEEVVAAIEDDLLGGCIASVTPVGVRVRRLPVHLAT